MEEEKLDDLDINIDEGNDNDLLSEDFSLDDNFGSIDSSAAMEKHSELLKQLTNFEPFLTKTIYGWLGVSWDEKQKRYIKKYKPLMNEEGVMWCVSFLQKYTRENNIITTIREKQYNEMVADVVDVVYMNIGTRAEEFGVKTNGDIFRICEEMIHSIQLILMGAGDGRYNKLLTDTTQRNENVTLNPEMPMQTQKGRKGIVGKMLNKMGL